MIIFHYVFIFGLALSIPIEAFQHESIPDGVREIFTSSQHGSVEGDAYVYYNIRYATKSSSISNSGIFQRIELHSLEGDADLYISSSHRPTWANYALCSRTTGFDVVWASSRFERPLQVGVYGHPAHNRSAFELVVVDLQGFFPAVEEPPTSYYEAFTYEQLDRAAHVDESTGTTSASSSGATDPAATSESDSTSIFQQIAVIIFKIILEVLA